MVGEIYGPNPSNPDAELTIANSGIYSVFDIDASLDGGNNYTVYAATARWSAPGQALGMYEEGKLMKYTVTTGGIVDTAFTLSAATQDHGVMSVRLFDFSNWNLVFCLTKGYTGTGDDKRTEIHLLEYQPGLPSSPIDLGLLEIGSDENLQAPENIIDIYQEAGEIHFLVGGGSDIFEYSLPVQVDTLNDGVNWYSVNYYFPFDSIAFILSNLDSLIAAADQWGHQFFPDSLDSIYVWDPLECYKIRVSGDDEFEAFFDNKIPTDTNIVLIDDDTLLWNFIAFLPEDSLRCDTVFAEVGSFLMVKNDDGCFWGDDVGTTFYMRPGEGYQVKVSARDTLNYPASQGGESVNPLPFGNKDYSQAKTNSLPPTHFVFTDKTGDFYPIIIDQIMVNGVNPEYGDEIGIFTPDDICVGAVKYEGEFPLNFPAWKDDPWTVETDGYIPNQQMVFKLWDASAEVEIPLTLLLIIPENIEIKEGNKGLTSLPSAEFFEEDDYFRGTLEGNYLLPLEFSLSQNYPNPFNPTTSIRYTIKWRSQVKISIFNLLGQEVVKLVDDFQDSGQYRIEWNGENRAGAEISSGIYFLKMSAKSTEAHFGKYESFHKSIKMLMLK